MFRTKNVCKYPPNLYTNPFKFTIIMCFYLGFFCWRLTTSVWISGHWSEVNCKMQIRYWQLLFFLQVLLNFLQNRLWFIKAIGGGYPWFFLVKKQFRLTCKRRPSVKSSFLRNGKNDLSRGYLNLKLRGNVKDARHVCNKEIPIKTGTALHWTPRF